MLLIHLEIIDGFKVVRVVHVVISPFLLFVNISRIQANRIRFLKLPHLLVIIMFGHFGYYPCGQDFFLLQLIQNVLSGRSIVHLSVYQSDIGRTVHAVAA